MVKGKATTNHNTQARPNPPKPSPGRSGRSAGQKTAKAVNIMSYLVAAAIVTLTLIVFSNTLRHQLTNWDDNQYILDNPYIKDLSWSSVRAIFSNFYFSNYHPLTTLTYAVDYNLYGLNPEPYHAWNLVWHLLNVILAFILIRQITKKWELAAIVSLLFAVHPMHVESVAWVSERKDLVYSFFFLGALIFYVKYLQKNLKTKYLGVAFLAFLLSCLSKSAAITLPLVLFLFDFYLKRPVDRRAVLEKIPFLLVSVLFGILALKSQNVADAKIEISNFTILDRFFLVSYSVLFYLYKMILPVHLAALHYYPVKTGGLLPFWFYLSPLILAGIIFGVYKAGKFRKELVFGLLFFAITIALIVQLVPIGRAMVAERYSYIPYLGLFFILAQLFSYLKNKSAGSGRFFKPYGYLVAAYTVFCISTTYSRNEVWAGSLTLFEDLVKKYPDRYYSYWSRGNARKETQDYRGAVEDFTKAIQIDTSHYENYKNKALVRDNLYESYNNRALAKSSLDDYEGALEDFNAAIKVDPASPEAYSNRGLMKARQKDFTGAIEDYNKAISIDPKLGVTYSNRGMARHNLNDLRGAIEDYNKAIALKPTADTYMNRGLARYTLNEAKEAAEDYTQALRINPSYPEAYNFRGVARIQLKDPQGALDDFTRAIKLRPEYSEAYFNKGLLMLNSNNRDEACFNFRKARELGNMQAQDVLYKYCR